MKSIYYINCSMRNHLEHVGIHMIQDSCFARFVIP